MMAAGMLAATSCSDFSDYNETPVDVVASGNQSLWENISKDGQLTEFASLLQRVGFDTKLSESRAYTVWAPADGTFNVNEFSQMNDSLLLQQFVKSHVAEYTHGATGMISERVHTLNNKSFLFEGDGSYTFDNIAVTRPNQPSSNGVMHVIGGAARFYPNLIEYLNMGEGFDNLRDYIMHYNDTTLSDESVKGPMVNGVQTYLDSVLVVNNSLINRLRAQIENEDSSYTFVIPTDEAYQKMYNRVKPLFNFITQTKVQDLTNDKFNSASSTLTRTSPKIDAAQLADSLTRFSIVRDLIYSNNDLYNQWVVGRGENTDTLRSTTRRKLSNPDDILNKYRVGAPVELSNGNARIVDSLAFYPWETFNQQIDVNPRYYLAKSFSSTIHNQTLPEELVEDVFGPESGITNFRYYWIEPDGIYSKPDFFITLPDVLSAEYDFYVVFLPSAWRQLGNDARPSKVNFQLNYCNTNGDLKNFFFSKGNADLLQSGGKPVEVKAVNATTAFQNDPTKTDTVYIGRFKFPVAYAGLSGDYAPNIRCTTPVNPLIATQTKANTLSVRIAEIILKPVEDDQIEANNK